MKSATKTASTKPAKLENGVTVNVPEFVSTGEKVRVNPQTGRVRRPREVSGRARRSRGQRVSPAGTA